MNRFHIYHINIIIVFTLVWEKCENSQGFIKDYRSTGKLE